MNSEIYISTNLKYLRMINGKNQKDLANYLHCTPSAIGNWETGLRKPDAVDLFLIARYFNVTIDDLISKDLRTCKIDPITSQLNSKIQNLSDEKKRQVLDIIDVINK